MFTKNIFHNRGQIALVMVLIMTVMSAVVVSVAGRVNTETNIQTKSEDSTEAFLVAQSALEEARAKGTEVSGTVGTDKAYNVVLDNSGQNGLITENITAGTSIDIILNSPNPLTGLKVYWKSASSTQSVIVVSKILNSTIEESAYDTTIVQNGFTKAVAPPGGAIFLGTSFPYHTPQIALTTGVKRVRISVYGEAATLGIEPVGDIIPLQTISYKAESTVGTTTDNKIKYGLLYEESKNSRTPEVFDNVLFSMGTINQ